MKNFFIAFGVFLAWSFFGLWIYSWIQPEKQSAKLEIENTDGIPSDPNFIKNNSIKITDTSNKLTENQPIASDIIKPSENDKIPSLKVINESGELLFTIEQSISFKKNNIEIINSQPSENYLNVLRDYLLEHPEQELHINSLYSPKELVLTPNIGIQRAKTISNQIVMEGVSEEKIVLKSMIKDIAFNKDGLYNNGIQFSFNPINQARIDLLKKEPLAPILVYPEFSDRGIAVNKNLRSLLKELKEYYKNNPNKKVEVVGHTDNIGNSKDNYDIGLKYSKQVRLYLINNGKFDSSFIRATSKGESEPIDDNYSESGRIANRRIEVIFK